MLSTNENRLTELRAESQHATAAVKQSRIALAEAIKQWSAHGVTDASNRRDWMASNVQQRAAGIRPAESVPGPSHYDRIRQRGGDADRGYGIRPGTSTKREYTPPKLPSQR